ncbi:acyl-CoA thioesterase [Yinghuangia aomiensis]
MEHPTPNPAAEPASVVVERRVEWPDTDAAGHRLFSAVQRWAEAAEAVLLGRLACGACSGSTPRVHYEADFLRRLWFRRDGARRAARHQGRHQFAALRLRRARRRRRRRHRAHGRRQLPGDRHRVGTVAGGGPRLRLAQAGPQEPETYTTRPFPEI